MRATIYIFGAVVIASLLLAYISQVYVIVQSKGSIIPEGQSVVVEAESPGVITDLKVALGDKVSINQTIVELRQDAAGVGLTTLRDQLSIQKNNKHYDKAYSQLYYKFVKGPKDRKKTAKINNKLKTSSRTNIVAMPEVGPTYPSIRTGRVDVKKPFIARYDNGTVITVHPDTGLITADFKL